MSQISNASIIIFETYHYGDHREVLTRTQPISFILNISIVLLCLRVHEFVLAKI